MKQKQASETTGTPCANSIKISDLADFTSKTPTAILGSPQFGKTNLSKHIVQALSQKPNVMVRIFDSSTKWLFDSPCDVSVLIEPPMTSVMTLDGEVLLQQQIPDQALRESLHYKNVVYDFSECDHLFYEREIMSRLIYLDKQKLIKEVKKNEGIIKKRIIFVFEEAQSVLGSNSLRRNNLSFLSKAVSVGSNYGLSLLIVTRRASEVSTQIFEHTTCKCVTNSNQPNCIRKLKTIFSKSDVERIKTLGVGEFLVLTPSGTYELKTSVFVGKTPQQLKITYKTKERFRDKVKNFIKKLFRRKKKRVIK